DQDYLCEGLAEELINALTHVDGTPGGVPDSLFSISCSWGGRSRGRAAARRGDVARRQRSESGRSLARDGPACGNGEGLSPLVAAFRSQARRRLCDPGRNRRNRGDVPARERFRRAGALFEDGQTERALEWSQRSLELYPEDMG